MSPRRPMRPYKVTVGLATVLLTSCALLSPEDPMAHVQFDAEASVDTGVVHYSLFVTNGSREEVFSSVSPDVSIPGAVRDEEELIAE